MKNICINEGCTRIRHSVGKNKFRSVCYHCHRAYRGHWDYTYGVKPLMKNYCENIDGRLGFKCTATIVDKCQIDMDHIDNNNNNNSIDNIQFLCSNCHRYKTKKAKAVA
jgi:hypothetical protein